MRQITFYMIFILTSITLFAQDNYYWYNGQKIFLEELKAKKFIVFRSSENISSLKNTLNINNLSVEKSNSMNVFSSLTPYKDSKIEKYKWAILKGDTSKSLINKKEVFYEAPFFLTPGKIEAGLSNLLYVKLNDTEDINMLEEMAAKNGVEILGSNKFMPLWYTLSCSKLSNGNSLDMANQFYESGKFAAAQPDLMSDDYALCVDDTHFNNQWALDNTGQHGGVNGIDINYCEAREITMGNQNVVVAVLDQGVELNHPDLTNMHPASFDTESGTSPSQVLGDHGTACAGIIGANSDNGDGVAGIAPDSPIMSISNSLAGTPNSRQNRADGINFAVNNGASVINNSWSSAIQYQIIDDAITNALTNGRNGLGCIVVFSSGNDNGAVSYPANSNDDILVVGAMSPCGERKNPGSCDGENWWGGNFGAQLDVSAPGVLVPTTDRQGANGYNNSTGTAGNFTQDFNGTSAASPHVAAVAALVLSIDPTLTFEEVNNIIESTAQKVGGYNYSNSTNRPNGTWNNEMGYGLIDAFAAVQEAIGDITISGPDEVCSNTTFTLESGSADSWQVSSDLLLIGETGTTITVEPKYSSGSTGSITANLSSGIEVSKEVKINNPPLTGEDITVRDSYFNSLSGDGTMTSPYLICEGAEYVISMYSNKVEQVNYSTFPSGWTSYSYGVYEIAFTPNNISSFTTYSVLVDYTGACGSALHTIYFAKETFCTGGMYVASPNPANNNLNVEYKSSEKYGTSSQLMDLEADYKIYDFQAKPVKQGKLKGQKTSLDVSALRKGIYILKIYVEGDIETHKIIIE